ncbi:MAG: methyltransferase [Syntrophorhabdaceae bacterium]|nr:methyltransferase [Syntrophorhabdaceae bacterium]
MSFIDMSRTLSHAEGIEREIIPLQENETLETLCHDRLKVIQRVDCYRFSIDSILLANFLTLKRYETLLDIGTGCGIIPLYLTKRGYRNPMVGVEIQKELFDVAIKNRVINDCPNVQFIHGDIRPLSETLRERKIQVIVSNPPYTKEDSGRRSPKLSRLIARYEATLDIKTFISISSSILNRKGRLYTIYPVRRLEELITTSHRERLTLKRIRFVHPRQEEKANLFLSEFVKEGGMETIVEKPLFIYRDGAYTGEVESYYHIEE